MKSGQWYYTAVNALAQKDIVGGYGDGTFQPNAPITRVEFLKILCVCMGTTSGGSVTFNDVSSGHWGYRYICTAVANGWANGYGDGTFRPDNNMTRAEATKMVNVALGRTGDGFAADRNEQKFIDVPQSHWAFLHVAEAAEPKVDASSATGTVTGNEVRVRSGPGTSYEVLGYVNSGDKVTVLSSSSGWLRVRTASGITGYISGDYVRVETTTTPPSTGDDNNDPPSEEPNGTLAVGDTARVTATDGLRLRKSPVNGETLKLMTYGSVVTVKDVSQDPWLQVTTSDGTTGYAHSDYMAPYTPGVASSLNLSASNLTLHQYETVRLDVSTDVSLSDITWSSSNGSAANVGYMVTYSGSSGGAMIYGYAPGSATITFRDAGGNVSKSVNVTVTRRRACALCLRRGEQPPGQRGFQPDRRHRQQPQRRALRRGGGAAPTPPANMRPSPVSLTMACPPTRCGCSTRASPSPAPIPIRCEPTPSPAAAGPAATTSLRWW